MRRAATALSVMAGCANTDCGYSDYLDTVAFDGDGRGWVNAASGGLGACDGQVDRSEITLAAGEEAEVETFSWTIGSEVSDPPSGFSAAFEGGVWDCDACSFGVLPDSGENSVLVETGGEIAGRMRISLVDGSGSVLVSTEI